MITLKTDIKKFGYVIQIADIHIKLLKRHDEFREVFQRLFDSVKETPENTAIFILGDVLHSKLDLVPECIQLTKEFLVGLSDLRQTILIAGNHDCNLSNKNRLDSLSPIVEAINHPNLFYLKESGLYGLGNICINNYSIFDGQEKYIKGCDIPEIYKNKYEYFICLYHGQVDGAITELGFKIVNKSVSVSIFDGHDICMLGDIHRLQDLQQYDYQNNKPIVRFPGSLCQHNHGESLRGHGYSLWDLKSKTYKHIEIPNDYGYFTIKIDKGEIKTDLTNIPKKARIRLSCFESLPSETKEALKEIKKITTLVEPPTYTREDTKEDGTKATLTVNLLSGDLKNRDYQIKLISEFLKNKLKIDDSTLLQEVIRINDETNANVKTDDIAKNIRWNPIRFEWENLFSFGEDNVIDFTKMKDVVGVFGKNASGKSSIMSSLSWVIWDRCEREFKANNIINDQKMSCRALLEVDIGGVRHFIERTGKMDKKGAVKVNVRFWKVIDGKEEDLTGIERSDTNNVIRTYMGSYEDFLLTSLSVQKSGKYETSFIDLGDSGRKDLLAQFLGLNIFDILHETANKKLNEIISTLKIYKNEDYEGYLKINQDSLSQITLALEFENKKLSVISEQKDILHQKIVDASSKYITVEGCSYSSLSEINSLINKNKWDDAHNVRELQAILNEKDRCNIQILEISKKIDPIDFDDLSRKYSEREKLLESKNDLSVPLSRKIAEAKALREKVDRVDGYQFDPDCSFCVKNADVIILDGKNAEKELERYKKEVKQLLMEQTTIDNKITSLSSVESDYKLYNTLLKERTKLQGIYFDWEKKATEVRKKIETLKTLMGGFENQLEEFKKNKSAIENNTSTDSTIFLIKKELTDVSFQYKKTNENVQLLVGKKSIYSSKIDELKKKLDKVKEIEKQYEAYNLYVQSVCRDGIPYEVIASAVPHIEDEVNSILSQIVEFHARFNVDGKNIIPYIVYDERRWLMSLGSGMEQFILSMAIRVALCNISNLPRMSGIIIDEGMSVMDGENLSSLPLLFTYLKSQFEWIIIISHLDFVKDMVDNHIELKKENGFSKITHV